ncbi:MAG: hypothetical protein OEW99_09145 [Gammaproteobacteria bacterium]|nr:hypothetical protein [Gammaproteobacteria bacterium]
MQKFNTALLLFTGALLMSIQLWGLTMQRKRNKELIGTLNKHGEL